MKLFKDLLKQPEVLDLISKLNGALLKKAEKEGYSKVYEKFLVHFFEIEEIEVEDILAGLGEVGG